MLFRAGSLVGLETLEVRHARRSSLRLQQYRGGAVHKCDRCGALGPTTMIYKASNPFSRACSSCKGYSYI